MQESGLHTAEDGTRIWYGTSGEGPMLVFCDGLACDGFIWPYLIDAFVTDHQVLRWHYPAHGRSEAPDDLSTLSVERFARDLDGVLRQFGDRPVVPIGHSLGVQVILEYYALRPDRVRGLVAICGNYGEPLDTFHNTDTLRRALPYLRSIVDGAPGATQMLWKNLIDSSFSKLVATVAETNPELMRSRDIEPYLEHAARMDVAAFVRMLENVADHTAEDLLPDIDVPTLVVAGEDDTFTPMYRSKEMADRVPESRLVVVPGGTHAAPLEDPKLIEDAIDEFLSELDFDGAEAD